jgi:hypothetical protein
MNESFPKREPVRLSGKDWQALVRKVMRRDGWQCRNPECGERRHLSVHHVLPRSQGGDDVEENLITLCIPNCHDPIHAETKKLVIDKIPGKPWYECIRLIPVKKDSLAGACHSNRGEEGRPSKSLISFD